MFVFLRSPIVVMILILCVSTNFFKNLANIYKYNIDQRINNVYGYCSNSSIGYLNYLKKKYKINHNQKIINYKQTGPVKWAMTNTKNSFKNTVKHLRLDTTCVVKQTVPKRVIFLYLLHFSNKTFQNFDFNKQTMLFL